MSEYTSQFKRFCSVYKSSKKQEMYLYVERKQAMQELPEGLLAVFGHPVHVLDLILTPEKKLARVEASKVLEGINEKGFYLQMPPTPETTQSDSVYIPKDSLHG